MVTRFVPNFIFTPAPKHSDIDVESGNGLGHGHDHTAMDADMAVQVQGQGNGRHLGLAAMVAAMALGLGLLTMATTTAVALRALRGRPRDHPWRDAGQHWTVMGAMQITKECLCVCWVVFSRKVSSPKLWPSRAQTPYAVERRTRVPKLATVTRFGPKFRYHKHTCITHNDL